MIKAPPSGSPGTCSPASECQTIRRERGVGASPLTPSLDTFSGHLLWPSMRLSSVLYSQREGRAFVSAEFVRREDDTVVRHLIDAARQYEARRFDAVVVPANIAAVAAITPAVTAALSAYGTTESREAFLRDGATYSHQLRRMPEHIRSLASSTQRFYGRSWSPRPRQRNSEDRSQ